MFGGSVRDRVKAAEAAQGGAKGDTSSNPRRGQKLALNTDEHIKEEFLRRGDGGWSKKVDIGQQEAFVPSASVPFIKVTLETPVVESKDPKLPGKLPKSHFASISEEQEGVEASASSKQKSKEVLIEDAEPNESQRSPPIIVEPPTATIDPGKREVHPEYAEDTLHSRSRNWTRRRSSKSRHARVEDYNDSNSDRHSSDGNDGEDLDGSRGPSRSPSKRRQRRSSRQERPLLEEVTSEETSRARSRGSRSKSAQREHSSTRSKSAPRDHDEKHSHAGIPASADIRRSSSRSGSTHRTKSESHHSPPTSARQSSNTLWPSFSRSERRSMGDIFETGSIRSKSPRPRANSTHSATSVRTDDTSASKTIGIAEYFAGGKLEHVTNAPLSPPMKDRPLGFVRSKSSSGEYSEYYTREKHILRKPEDDEVFESIEEHHKVRLEHRNSHHRDGERKKSDATPWQVKLMQGIAKH